MTAVSKDQNSNFFNILNFTQQGISETFSSTISLPARKSKITAHYSEYIILCDIHAITYTGMERGAS